MGFRRTSWEVSREVRIDRPTDDRSSRARALAQDSDSFYTEQPKPESSGVRLTVHENHEWSWTSKPSSTGLSAGRGRVDSMTSTIVANEATQSTVMKLCQSNGSRGRRSDRSRARGS